MATIEKEIHKIPASKNHEVHIPNEDDGEIASEFELQAREERYTKRPALCRVGHISKKLHHAGKSHNEIEGKPGEHSWGKFADGQEKVKNDNIAIQIKDNATNIAKRQHGVNRNPQHHVTHFNSSQGIVLHLKQQIVYGADDKEKQGQIIVQHCKQNVQDKSQPHRNDQKVLGCHGNYKNTSKQGAEKDIKEGGTAYVGLEKHVSKLTFEEREKKLAGQGDIPGDDHYEQVVIERHQLQPVMEEMVSRPAYNKAPRKGVPEIFSCDCYRISQIPHLLCGK